LGSVFRHTPDNSRLWNGMLASFSELTGTRAGRWGFLYWASDPFDNPDYEQFSLDFSRVFGIFPHTTTAQAPKDVERARELLRIAGENGCLHTRFYVLSIGALRRLTAAFTPEELGLVELVIQAKGSILRKQRAGRATDRLERNDAPVEAGGETIACVSGFLVNLPRQTIRLISPCPASARWPLGYRIHAEAAFQDVEEFRAHIRDMIDRSMYQNVVPGQLLRFVAGVDVSRTNDGFVVSNLDQGLAFHGNALLPELAEIVWRGTSRASEAAQYFQRIYGISPDTVYGWLNHLLDAGVLDDDPDVYVVAEPGP
jgi:radical SAM family RiPP maturation amino acid epimerase